MIGPETREIITVVLVLVSALMCFAAGVGLMRFPDVLSRLHAATKPQILGLMAIAAAIAVNNATIGTFALLTAIIIFQALTAPITAHMVARAAYRSDHLRRDLLIRDELSESVDKAEQGSAATAPLENPPAPYDDRPSG